MRNAEHRIEKSNSDDMTQKSEAGNRRVSFWRFITHHVSVGILRPSFCILHPAFFISSRSGQSRLQRLERSDCGQAMIEFTIALVAIIALAVGTILLNELERKHTSTMTIARGTAGSLAMDLIYHIPADAQFISDWQAGADNIGYTDDDEPITDGTAITLVGDITANSGLDSITAPANAISRLQLSPDISWFYLVEGNESDSVSLSSIPGAGRLFSREPAVSVESRAFLAWTGGIY